MNCPQCGDVCSCLPEPSPTASPRWMPDAENRERPSILVTSGHAAVEDSQLLDPGLHAREAYALPEDARTESEAQAGEGPAWRDELSARLHRYRAPPEARPPRYPALLLAFDAPSPPAPSSPVSRSTPEFETASNQALALDGLTEMSSPEHNESVASQPA